MTNNFDAVVVGAIGIDTNVYLYTDEVDFSVEANFSVNKDYIGQAGGYSARLFNNLGKKAAFIGFVGEDYHGEYIRRELESDGIDYSAVFSDPEGTKRSINFMYKDGRRKNFYDGKGAMSIMPDIEKCRNIFKRGKIAHFSIVNWARHLLPIAKDEGNIISCDIQDIVSVEDEYRHDFIKAADVLFFSAANFPDPTPLINKFLDTDENKIVICGMGKNGCALGTKDGIQFYGAVDTDTPVVDTNGAGDSLAVGFLSSRYLDGYSLEESIRRGQIAARYTCTVKASTSELITANELERLANR